MHQQENENKPPYKAALEEFIKLNPAAHNKEETKNYFSTAEIVAACNDIAYDETLTEELVLHILKENKYDLITMEGGLQRWVIR